LAEKESERKDGVNHWRRRRARKRACLACCKNRC